MKHFLSTFSTFINARRRSRRSRWCMVFLLVIGALLIVNAFGDQLGELAQSIFGNIPETFAQDAADATKKATTTDPASDSLGALGRGVGTVVAGLATLFIKLISGILYFVLKWMGPLMDNTFILEGDIGEKLRSVWVIVRNFVNIFFALALVVVALMSVVGYGDEGGNYALKKFIPKMALALIAVNFTFFACRIILDINNVLTTAIFSIPQSVTTVGDIGPSGTAGQTIFKKFNCFENTSTSINDLAKKSTELEKTYNGTIASLGGVCFAKVPDGATYDSLVSPEAVIDPNAQAIVSLDQTRYTKKDFVWVMATQFQGIHDLNKVSVLLDPTFSGLTVNALFSVVFAVIYATAYISMFIILIARMAVLWVTIMLSPLVAISIVFPDIKLDEFDIKEKFLTHAFVPAKMALPLSLGYIMLSQMTLAVDGSSGIFKDSVIDIAAGGEFARGVSFTTLIYGAASVAVLWMGVFSATKGVVGEGVVSTFSDSIKNIGKSVAKWPTYIPLSPVSNGMTLSSLKYTGEQIGSRLQAIQAAKNKKFADETLNSILPSNELRNAMERVVSSAKSDTINTSDLKTLTAAGVSTTQFGETIKDAFGSLKTDAKKLELARYAGFSTIPELESAINSGNFGQMQTAMRERLPGGPTGGPPANSGPAYADLPETTLSTVTRTAGVGIDGIRNIPSGDIRRDLGLEDNGDVNLQDKKVETMIAALKNRSLGSDGIRTYLRTGVLENLATQKPAARGKLLEDKELHNLLSGAIHAGANITGPQKEDNKKIRSTMAAIAGSPNASAIEAVGGGAVKISKIDAGDGVLKP